MERFYWSLILTAAILIDVWIFSTPGIKTIDLGEGYHTVEGIGLVKRVIGMTMAPVILGSFGGIVMGYKVSETIFPLLIAGPLMFIYFSVVMCFFGWIFERISR